jgi:repressor LexA
MNDIRKRLLDEMKMAELSYADLSRQTGIPKSNLQRMFTGETKKMEINDVQTICEAMGLNTAEVLGWVSAPSNLIPLDEEPEVIPLYDGIACGSPRLVDSRPTDHIKLPTHVHARFAVICRGDSMSPRIQDGDVVYIRPQPEVEQGQIAAVTIHDGGEAEATLKRVYTIPGGVMLSADNPAYPPMTYIGEAASQIRIEGLAVAFTRSLE